MIRRILTLGIILVALIIGYNLYYGTPEEKANAREIVDEVKNIGKASWELLKSEKEKMEAGKYDDAAEKIKGVFERLRGIAEGNEDTANLDRLRELEAQRQAIERRLQEMNRPSEYSDPLAPKPTESRSVSAEEEQLHQDIKRLYEETERLMRDMERN